MTTTTHKKNLSYINNLDDLQTEIRKLKSSVRQRETDLQQRWNALPKETMKATLGSVVPVFLNNTVADKTWGLVKGVGSILLGKSSGDKSKWKHQLLSSAKSLGFITLLKTAYRFWMKK